MSRFILHLRRRASDDRGAVLILVAIGLPAFIAFGIFVVDVGNWWVHKRHLQVQADAAALAGAMAYRFPGCDDNAIGADAIKYSGAQKWDTTPASYADATSTFNAQLGGSAATNLWAGINRPTVYGRDTPIIDSDLVGSPKPCSTGFVDVKATETDLPWFFELGAALLDKFNLADAKAAYIDAQARVTLKTLVGKSGMLPLGVEDVAPKSAHVWVYDETPTPATAELLGQADLKVEPDPLGRLAVWSNSVTVDGSPITFSPHTSKMAVRVGLSGATTTDWSAADVCSRALVLCYGYGVPAAAPATHGVTRIRGFATTGTGLRVGNVEMVRGTCADTSLPNGAENGYFATSCSNVTARVEMIGASITNGTLKGRVDGMNGNSTNTFTFDPGLAGTADDRWVATFPLNLAGGAHMLDLTYTQSGSGSPCPNSTPCLFPDVQSSFKGSRATSGPLKMVRIDAGSGATFGTNVNNVARCAVGESCPTTFVVRIGLAGDLALAQPGDAPISLRVFGGSQNQSLDCDPFSRLIADTGQTQQPSLDDEIATGCAPGYIKNTGQSCPGSQQALWDLAQPWNCVAIQTGTNANAPARGFNRRVFGDPAPGNIPCPSLGANRYDQNGDGVPDYPLDDKRLVPVFLVPFGTFDGNGNAVVPVIGFASFYVTGWTSNGNGFRNPCKDDGDEFEFGTEDDSGAISGHFVIRVESTGTSTPGETNCDTTIIGGCVAVMTK
jgi:hypothetical protein